MLFVIYLFIEQRLTLRVSIEGFTDVSRKDVSRTVTFPERRFPEK